MAKTNPEIWAKARALFEADKSFREIARRCYPLDSSNIAKIAKKENWQRGILPQLIVDKARVDAESARIDAEFTTLLPQQQAVVVKEVNERNKHIQFFTNATLKNCQIMMKKVDDDADFADHKVVQDTLTKGKETVLGKTPDTAIQINNSAESKPAVTEIKRIIVDPTRDY